MQVDIARRIALVIAEDSGGFARRAAMGLFHHSIKVDDWVRKCSLSPDEWRTYKSPTSGKQNFHFKRSGHCNFLLTQLVFNSFICDC